MRWGNMTFNATEIIVCSLGEIIRFRRKNCYIDLMLDSFKNIADLKGDTAEYCVEHNNKTIVLKWAIRKKIKKVRGIVFGNNICIESEVHYFRNGNYSVEYVNDFIAIVKLNFLSKELRERMCYILGSNIGIPVRCKYDNVKDSVLAFEIPRGSDNIDKEIMICLNNILKTQDISVAKTEKKKSDSGVEYYVTLAVV